LSGITVLELDLPLPYGNNDLTDHVGFCRILVISSILCDGGVVYCRCIGTKDPLRGGTRNLPECGKTIEQLNDESVMSKYN